MKKFLTKITVLVSYNVPDNVREWFFIREFPTSAMLNQSIKSRFM